MFGIYIVCPVAQVKTCLYKVSVTHCAQASQFLEVTPILLMSPDPEMFYDTSHSCKTRPQRSHVWSGACDSCGGSLKFLLEVWEYLKITWRQVRWIEGMVELFICYGEVDVHDGWSCGMWDTLSWCRISFSTPIPGCFFWIAHWRSCHWTWN